MKRRGGPGYVLQREVGKEPSPWRIEQPVSAMSDEDATDTLLSALEWAEPRRAIGTLAEGDRARFGFDAPRVAANLTVAEEALSLILGAPDARGQGSYALVDDEVYVVGDDLVEALDQDPSEFRDRRVVQDDNVILKASSIEFQSAGIGKTSLVFDKERWFVSNAPPSPAAAQEVDALKRSLRDLALRDFRDGEDRRLMGFDRPWLFVEIHPRDGDSQRLVVGKECPSRDGERYATFGAVVGCVRESDFRLFTMAPDHYREQRMVTVDPNEVTRIEVRDGDRTLDVFADGKGVWRRRAAANETAMSGRVIAAEAVLEYLRQLGGYRASRIVSTSGPPAPGARSIAIETQDKTREVVHLRSHGPSFARVSRGSEDVALVFEDDIRDVFEPSGLRFYSRQIASRQVEDIVRVRRETRRGEEEASRSDSGWKKTETGAPLDATRVRPILRAIANLRATKFVSERALPSHGLKTPALMLEVEFREQGGSPHHHHDHDHPPSSPSPPSADHSLRVSVGLRAPQEAGYFAQKDGEGPVFVIDAAVFDTLMQSF